MIISEIRNLWFSKFEKQGRVNLDQFLEGLEAMGVKIPRAEAEGLFNSMDKGKDGMIDYLEWTSSLQLEDMVTRQFFVRSGFNKSLITRNGSLPLLNEQETKLMDSLMERVNTIAEAAHRKGVRLLIDAEQTYMQPVIDHVALKLQRRYNRDIPIVYNTYQCYLTSTKQRLVNDVERGNREGFHFAAKLVRGAYMVQERQRSKDRGEVSPILETKADTDTQYDECVKFLLENIDHQAIMLATHNQHSIQYATDQMNKYGHRFSIDKAWY
jgi:proline dehydrogenase